jgi:hypothetical protein
VTAPWNKKLVPSIAAAAYLSYLYKNITFKNGTVLEREWSGLSVEKIDMIDG